MSNLTKRATVYVEPEIYRALKIKAAETSTSVSSLINDAAKAALAEDEDDIAAFEERAHEPLISFAEVVKKLKKDGRI